MITKWSLRNFKSARQPIDLPLSRLTLFAGANSSGKSTLIQSILLVAQTFASKVPARQCVLNGNLVSLGGFSDLLSSGSPLPDIEIGWECEPLVPLAKGSAESIVFPRRLGMYDAVKPSLSSASCTVAFRRDPTTELSELQPIPWRCMLTAHTSGDETEHRCVAQRATDAELAAKGQSLTEHTPPPARATLAYNIELDTDSVELIRSEFGSAEPIGCSFHHFLPRHVSARLHLGREFARFVQDAFRDELRPRQPRALMFEELPIPDSVLRILREHVTDIDPLLGIESPSLPGIGDTDKPAPITFKDWLRRFRRLPPTQRLTLRKKFRNLSKEIREAVPESTFAMFVLAPVPLPTELSLGAEYLDEFFANRVKYLGPLRDEPKPVYPRGANPDPSDVGLRGEFTAAVLELHRTRTVKYMPPGRFLEPAVTGEAATAPLEDAVTEWLRYLGVAHSFRTRDMGRYGHELRVAPQSGPPYDLTHVGVGLSQVLPILVSALLADHDTALIFEQPELHLHPKVQTRLADFFLSMALLNKQCIIETHSEYLVNQLRLRVAASDSPAIASASRVYFVENHGEGSVFREVAINRFGAILDWPEDFFDQAQKQSEEILMAAALKRRRERQE